MSGLQPLSLEPHTKPRQLDKQKLPGFNTAKVAMLMIMWKQGAQLYQLSASG